MRVYCIRVVARNLVVFAANKAEGGEGELADPLFGLSVLPGASRHVR